MNFYSFHIGDYATHTAHLDPIEDVTYRRMLDLYYLREAPLPSDVLEVARLIRMKDHKECVEAVLHEFFIHTDNGWVNGRCNAGIAKMQDKQAKAKASAAISVAARSTNAQRTLNERSTNAELPIPIPIPIPNTDKDMETPEDVSPVPYAKIVDLYHSILPELRQVAKLNETRKAHVRQRWKNDLPEIEEWEKYFSYVRESAFLMGQVQPSFGRKPFIVDFDWLINGTNALKIAEGKYHG